MPVGWMFEDSLRNSALLRFLAGFVPHVTMLVDADSNEVVVLRMGENELLYTLKLNSAKPQPPRRHNNYLYLDMGIGLVFVVDLAGQPPVGIGKISGRNRVIICRRTVNLQILIMRLQRRFLRA